MMKKLLWYEVENRGFPLIQVTCYIETKQSCSDINIYLKPDVIESQFGIFYLINIKRDFDFPMDLF